MFQEGTLKTGDKNAIRYFSEKYIVSEKLVADYIDHLTDIELRNDKQQTENDRRKAYSKGAFISYLFGGRGGDG